MTNIPTDLLRTLVAVVDLRSFTKAAISLGVTQPAVSAQIKRLQFLLGDDIFDRSTQGVSLTRHGEIVVSYARRLLSINDQIVHLGGADQRSELVIRVGTSSNYVGSLLPDVLANFRARWPDVRFIVRTDHEEPLLRSLRVGDLDLFVGLSMRPSHDALYSWAEEMVWARGEPAELDPARPVPLVSYGDPCIHHRLAVRELDLAGRDWEIVFSGSSMTSLDGAVAAGLGILAMTRRRATETGMIVCGEATLPKLPDLYRGIYIREGGVRSAYEELAAEISATLRGAAKTESLTLDAIGMMNKAGSAA